METKKIIEIVEMQRFNTFFVPEFNTLGKNTYLKILLLNKMTRSFSSTQLIITSARMSFFCKKTSFNIAI